MSKPLNPKQAKFVELYTAGGMSRGQAYAKAYDYGKTDEDRENARKAAYQLIATNIDVKAKIDELLDVKLEAVKERLMSEADATVERYFFLREGGNSEYGVQFQVCKDHFDRIGLKPKKEIEHSGEVNVSLLDVVIGRAKGGGDD